MIIIVQVHHFDQSFLGLLQTLILWNTNALFGKKEKENVSDFVVQGL